MPGLDGTGPAGHGPMTGQGRGFCILRIPPHPGQPVTGVAGKTGWPVGPGRGSEAELTWLRGQAMQLETILWAIRRRVHWLQGRLGQAGIGA